MHPIFFVWQGDYDALVATGFHGHGRRTRSVAIEHGKSYFGLIEAKSPAARPHLATLHERFAVLPGPHGKLSAAHAAVLAKILPEVSAKEGDTLEAVLLHVHGLYGDPEFHPDCY